MENTAVNLSPFVTPLQIRDGAEYLFQPLHSYRTRVEQTILKLDSIIDIRPQFDTWGASPTYVNPSEYDQWCGDRSIAIEIRNTIGVYNVFSDKERKAWTGLTIPALWEKEKGGYTLGVNNVWQDWLGDNTISGGITVYGGKVVVSLSDFGVEYMNKFANRVSFLTTV
jgi:hypothetical protein